MPQPKPNPKAASIIRAIRALMSESLDMVADSVETGRFQWTSLVGLVDNVQEIILIAQED